MTPEKRMFDIMLALVSIILFIGPCLLIGGVLLCAQGRPIIYRSERMKAPDQAFLLWKFRTMQISSMNSGVSGGDKLNRVTPIGRIMRRTRIDEVPQLWNILRGDLSFVGPRPPLRLYVEQFPALYTDVLQCRPGLTGLATLFFHKREETLLSLCQTPAQTDAVYVAQCIPRKARLDLIYKKRRTLMLDVVLLVRTVRAIGKIGRSA